VVKMTLSNYIINPHEGVGELQFGMTPPQVKALLGEPDRKNTDQGEYYEIYLAQGLIVNYGIDGTACDSIEMLEGASPTLQGKTFLGEQWQTIASWFRSTYEDAEATDIGLRSKSAGLSISHAPVDVDCDVVKRLFIFERGYWDTARTYDFTPPGGWAETDEEFDAWVAATLTGPIET
jgi:hypothetical protein